MQVEIFSDVACPWCAVGKRRFEAALHNFEHASQVEVRWRSFQLDPSAPPVEAEPYAAKLGSKYGASPSAAQAMLDRMTLTGAEEGWSFRFDRIRAGNTFDAHRLLHLAHEAGMQDRLKERLFAGYFEHGEPIGDPYALERMAVEAGLPEDQVAAVLDSDSYADQVRADLQAAHDLGISGVPFFVVDRVVGVSGAQPVEVLVQLLEQAWAEARGPSIVEVAEDAHDA